MDFSIIDQYLKDSIKSLVSLEATLKKYGYNPKPDPEWEAMKKEVLSNEEHA